MIAKDAGRAAIIPARSYPVKSAVPANTKARMSGLRDSREYIFLR